jgi:hypothetical protein
MRGGSPVQPNPSPFGCTPRFVRVSYSKGHSHGQTYMYVENEPRDLPPHCPSRTPPSDPDEGSVQQRAGPSAVSITHASTLYRAPHARPLVNARHPHAATATALSDCLHAALSTTYLACAPLRPAPVSQCVGRTFTRQRLSGFKRLCHSSRTLACVPHNRCVDAGIPPTHSHNVPHPHLAVW